ncbi:MAG TPA: hypothetical protein VND19_20255 [Acetobacteraceae bacterium]|nr:hypothetical protein [Acetobacteraceae bacterium]
MAVIDIRAEPSGRTRVLFDFRAAAPGCDDAARIEFAMTQSRGGAPAHPPAPRADLQAASARNTSRPVTLPSRRRISAS